MDEPIRLIMRMDSHRIGMAQNICGLTAAGLLAFSAFAGDESLKTITGTASGAAFLLTMGFWRLRARILEEERPHSDIDQAVIGIIQRFSPICIRVQTGTPRKIIVDIEGGEGLTKARSRQIRKMTSPLKRLPTIEVRGESQRSNPQSGTPKESIILYRRWERNPQSPKPL